MVPHRSTNWARQCLTSLSRREAVLSLLYGTTWLSRQFETIYTHLFINYNYKVTHISTLVFIPTLLYPAPSSLLNIYIHTKTHTDRPSGMTTYCWLCIIVPSIRWPFLVNKIDLQTIGHISTNIKKNYSVPGVLESPPPILGGSHMLGLGSWDQHVGFGWFVVWPYH